MYQRLHVRTREFSSLTREIRHGTSRPDPQENRVSQVNRNVAGRVGSGRFNKFSYLAGRVGSGQEIFKFSRVRSGRVKPSKKIRGSGRPVKFDLTREKPCKFCHPGHDGEQRREAAALLLQQRQQYSNTKQQQSSTLYAYSTYQVQHNISGLEIGPFRLLPGYPADIPARTLPVHRAGSDLNTRRALGASG